MRKITPRERVVLANHYFDELVKGLSIYARGCMLPSDWKKLKRHITRYVRQVDELLAGVK